MRWLARVLRCSAVAVYSDHMPTLVLLRHAKSAWPPGVPDDERPLNPRGRRDAPVAGAVLAAGPPIDLALVSPAQRARETFQLATSVLPTVPPHRIDERVYDADVVDLLAAISEVADDVDRLLVVGHNPGTEMLAFWLAANTPTADYLNMSTKYPPAAIAEIDLPNPWRDIRLARGTGALVSFVIPRG